MRSVADEDDSVLGPGPERLLVAQLPQSARFDAPARARSTSQCRHMRSLEQLEEKGDALQDRLGVVAELRERGEQLLLAACGMPGLLAVLGLPIGLQTRVEKEGQVEREKGSKRKVEGDRTHHDGDDVEQGSSSARVGDEATVLGHPGVKTGAARVAVEEAQKLGLVLERGARDLRRPERQFNLVRRRRADLERNAREHGRRCDPTAWRRSLRRGRRCERPSGCRRLRR